MAEQDNPSVAAGEPWYRDAIFYEIPVKAYCDSNGDGIGDLPGLVRKLDYIQELGVTCIVLLPLCASPMRDDGYDVADYRAIHPDYGTFDDLRTLMREAHARQLRVMAEIVINHTSIDHPWFQAARAAPPGSPLRNFYLWSDSPERFPDAEILLQGVERANWHWDAQAKAYYWHRFFEHQPDLNFDIPQVRQEILKVLRFWADVGLDGLCLNGAAFLAEQPGTRCEHLPQTHTYLQEFAQQLHADYPHVVLHAGVNAWPADAKAYVEAGECQMVPHLPLAQRLFLALAQEDRFPVEDILRQTPSLPDDAQWLTLLRNHDELTLRIGTDEERDYMFRAYVSDPSMQRNAGILRRLAPLAENSRARIELLFGLLFSLPGAPLIYYGDEIGMGDNVFLGGRNGVRTPMQWSAHQNGGFSEADFARLYAPPVMDPVYGYLTVNVDSQRRDASSQLNWFRRLVALRKRHKAFSRGTLELLDSGQQKVLAFVRRYEPAGGADAETILVVANLSASAQPVQLDLSAFAGLVPVEMFGRSSFPRIASAPYTLSLAPHSFFWFQLVRAPANVAARRLPVATAEVVRLPEIDVPGPEAIFAGDTRRAIELHVLPGFLPSQRWFGGKARRIASARIADVGSFSSGPRPAWLMFVDVMFADESRSTYFLPVGLAQGSDAVRLLEQMRPWVLARLRWPDGEGVLFDALADDAFCHQLLDFIGQEATCGSEQGSAAGVATRALAPLRGDRSRTLSVARGPATSSNSIVFYGRRMLLKLFRRLAPGVNPDFEIGSFLTEERFFPRIPKVAGTMFYRPAGGDSYTLGILQAMVPNQGDGWQHTIDELTRYYRRAAGRMHAPDPLPANSYSLAELATATPPPIALETIASYLHAATTLGERTAEMHIALASDTTNPDFAPEPFTARDVVGVRDELMHQASQALTALGDNLHRLPPTLTPDARRLLESGPALLERMVESCCKVTTAQRTRIHGDYHLGQVLWTENDYMIIDFEGEPTRSVEERRRKYSPVRDVAGMLRSYHYAAFAGLFAFTVDRPHDFAQLVPWADLWQQWVSAAYLRAYLRTASPSSFLPNDPAEFAQLLDAFMLSKALYELSYELNNRPDWVRIPLSGVLALLRTERPASHAWKESYYEHSHTD